MTALLRAAAPAPLSRPCVDRPSDVLVLIRQVYQEARAAPHRTPQEACALVSPDASATAFARVLVQALPSILGHRPVIWAPNAAGRSFDEDWLIALHAAAQRQDPSSLRFLTARRVRTGATEALLFLTRGLLARLDKA